MLPEAFEDLTLALCKCQKRKEPVKVGCRKFGDLILKTVALARFLKTENLTENVLEFYIGLGIDDHPALIPCKLHTFSFRILEYFLFLKNVTSVKVFNPKMFICSFHF